MHGLARLAVAASTLLASVSAQGVILGAQGPAGPASKHLGLNQKDANDHSIINQTEIVTNVVNECGRTIASGNTDIGATTEDQIAGSGLTKVTKGSQVKVTIQQGGPTGAGPYTCDLDQQSNVLGASGQKPLTVTPAKAGANAGELLMTVTLPTDMKCIGASSGDVCTIRCKNKANFGGCFSVQQTDTTPQQNTPANIASKAALAAVMAQVAQDKQDLPKAQAAIASAGPADAEQGVALINAIVPDLKAATPPAPATPAAAAPAAAAAAGGAAGAAAGAGAAAAKGNGKGGNKGGNNGGAQTKGNAGANKGKGGGGNPLAALAAALAKGKGNNRRAFVA